jgi:hypothetical protein
MKKLGITVLSLSAAVFVYYLSKEPEKKPVKDLGKDLVIKILNSINLELKKIFISIASKADLLKQEHQKSIPPDFLVKKLFENFPLREDMQIITNKICSQFKTTEEALKHAVETVYFDDEDIKLLLSSMKSKFEAACKGIAIQEACTLPYTLTSKLTLSILKEFYDCELYLIYLKNDRKKNYKQTQDLSEEIDEFFLEFEDEKHDCMERIIKKHGIDASNQGHDIIRRALLNYKAIIPSYKSEISIIENKYNKKIDDILNKRISEDRISKLKKIFNNTYS